MSAPATLNDEIRLRYGLYTALHAARLRDPETFTVGFSNTVLGAILGGRRKHGWRVVGITKAALQAYKDCDFSRQAEKANGMTRGHLHRRIDTTAMVLDRAQPMLIDELAQLLWDRDMTIICVRGENKKLETGEIEAISFDNEDCQLFTGKQVGWQYGATEKAMLRKLAEHYL